VVFGLYGGVLADHMDRKKMIWATEFAAVDGLQRPSADAI
jgi:hypothetical protein